MIKPVSNAREYKKLAAVFVVLIIAATVASTVVGFRLEEWMRWFMGGFFIVFGGFKMIGYEMFIFMFPSYDILGRKFRLYTYLYPFIEVSLGILYILDLLGPIRDVVTLFIMTIGAIGVFKTLATKGQIRCACLGNVIKLPLSTVTLLEDLSMAAMALIMILYRVAF